jgi:acetyl-CoA synthetase
MIECRFAGPPPGISAAVVDAEGHRIRNRLGELSLLEPWPSMTYGFWNEPDRWTAAYSARFPDIYIHGDRAIEFEDGSWELPGRSDDLIKIGGKRIGPSEFEEVALGVVGVASAAAVGLPHPVKGEAVLMVLTLAPGAQDDRESIEQQVHERIELALGKPFRISGVAFVAELPVTRNSKVHRRVLRAWLSGTDPGDLSNLHNPEAENEIRRLGLVGPVSGVERN